MTFNRTRISAATRRIPCTDFVDEQFDTTSGTETTDVGVLLSTPRSGSTMLCELLRLNDGCVAHEYFQPFQYMPMLAERWHCLKRGRLDEAGFVHQLCRHRTSSHGWLGVNLHASHLRYFARMREHFGDVRYHYVYLARKDVIAQAISLAIARSSNQWSTEFTARSDATYSFRRILRHLWVIQNQNAVIQSFLTAKRIEHTVIYYEDLVAKPEDALCHFGCISTDRPLVLTPGLRRQSDARSAQWTQRFLEDILADQRVQAGTTGGAIKAWMRPIPRLRVM